MIAIKVIAVLEMLISSATALWLILGGAYSSLLISLCILTFVFALLAFFQKTIQRGVLFCSLSGGTILIIGLLFVFIVWLVNGMW